MTITINNYAKTMTVEKGGSSTIAAWIDPQGRVVDMTDRVRMELPFALFGNGQREMRSGVASLFALAGE